MEPNQNQNSRNNNLWIGELDNWMDEQYLKESCKANSKSLKIIYSAFLIYICCRH